MRHPRWPDQMTRLGWFMLHNDITIAVLAERSGLSHGYIRQLRYGVSSPTLDAMKWIAGAASDILGSRVHLGELFDLDYETSDDASDPPAK